MDHVRVEQREGVALVTLVDRERRNAMTATMVAEIVETFDALEADESVGAVVITGEPPGVLLGRRRRRARLAVGRAHRGRAPLDHVDLRRIPARAALAAADRRRGQRSGGRRGHEPRARVPRSHRRRVGRDSTRGSCASACTPAAATPGCSTGRSARRPRPRWCCSAPALDGARAAEVGLAWACHPDDELVDRAVEFAAGAAAIPRELSAAAVATLREAPWQAGLRCRGRRGGGASGLVARSGLVSSPIANLSGLPSRGRPIPPQATRRQGAPDVLGDRTNPDHATDLVYAERAERERGPPPPRAPHWSLLPRSRHSSPSSVIA